MVTRLGEDDLSHTIAVLQSYRGNKKKTAKELGLSDRQLRRRMRQIERVSGVAKQSLSFENPNKESEYSGAYQPPFGSNRQAPKWEIKSLADNTFRLAAFGDLHAASKYCRWDVREDLTRRAERFKAQVILDTGNWIDGLKPFNLHDLDAIGLESQCQLLAKKYPKTKIPTYAVTGADHEGWFVKSEGIDVGKYCESVMREAGHPWTNLGYMEADIILKNANTGKTSIMRVMHPGGGSAYAYSYRPQKIIECVPLNSEILTRNGWKTHSEVAVGDEVLGYDVSKDCCEWTPIKAIHVGIGDIVRYSNDQFSVECTANHRWATEWESRGGPNPDSVEPKQYSVRKRLISTIDDAKDRSRIIQAAVAPDGLGMPLMGPKEWLRRDLAVETVMRLTSGERRAFIEAMMLGEGTVSGSEFGRTFIFSQRQGPVNDAFRLACFLEGIATTEKLWPAGSFKPNGLPTARVTMLQKRMRICNKLKREELGEKEVWCVTTDLHTWVMRQGSLITITGNSFEGGEKPAVLLLGHYHKLDCGLIRNVWYVQCGTCQDQTPFLRQKAIEAHVGGVLVELEQDPKTGAIIAFTPQVRKYYNEAYYFAEGKANNRWSGHGPITQVPRA